MKWDSEGILLDLSDENKLLLIDFNTEKKVFVRSVSAYIYVNLLKW